MRRFAYCSNNRQRLLLGTPTLAPGENLYLASSQFDTNIYSLGCRFVLASVTGTQPLLWNTEASVPKNENWGYYMVGSTLAYTNHSSGRTDLKADLVIGHEYSLWVDYDAGALDWTLYDRTTGTTASGSVSVTDYTPVDSIVTLLGDRSGANVIASPGTLWDFVFVSGGDAMAAMWTGYGLSLYRVTFWFPMREGAGTSCPDLRSRGGISLTTGTSFSWTKADSDPTKRWQ